MASAEYKNGRSGSALWVATFAVVVALFASVLIRKPDNFFADDSYFYFQVAWNIARGLGSTFNNVMPTNGYHPLWMLVCILNFKIFSSKAMAVHGIGAFIAFFDAGALLLLGRTLRWVAPGAWWCAVLLYVPFCFLTQLGTEGALSGFFLAAYVGAAYALYTKPGNLHGFLLSATAGLALLSRLDNVFVVGLMYLAILFAAPGTDAAQVRRYAMLWSPVVLLLGAAYLVSNEVWFGTLQPISGMLKAHAHGEGTHFKVLPHVALLGLAVISPCLAVLARYRRDAFFWLVELPFALGVFVHAGYIVFAMSSETRWTWYYTSWILLGAILLSRVVSLATERQPERVRLVLMAAALVLLLGVWVRGSYPQSRHSLIGAKGEGFEENMGRRLHLHLAIAFDKPGRMAYYSEVPIVALDGLMGDLKFQRDLGTKGIAAFDAEHGVDAFVGPPVPFGANEKADYCDVIYLSSVRFHCLPAGEGKWMPDGAEVFARLTGKSAGWVPLPEKALVWNERNLVAVWRLSAAVH